MQKLSKSIGVLTLLLLVPTVHSEVCTGAKFSDDIWDDLKNRDVEIHFYKIWTCLDRLGSDIFEQV